jgi:hypothetical protein
MFGRLHRTLLMIGTGVVAAAVLAGGVAFAGPGDQSAANHGKYADVFVTKLATILNVDKDTLVANMKQAGSQTLDEAVAAGDLAPNKAKSLKQRIETGSFSPNGPDMRDKKAEMDATMIKDRQAIMVALAQKLGMTTDQLAKELRSGKTLHRIGTEHNVSDQDLRAAMLSVVQPRLAEAVQNGDLSQKQADAMVSRVQNADLDLAYPMGAIGGGKMGHGGGFHSKHGMTNGDESGGNGEQQ